MFQPLTDDMLPREAPKPTDDQDAYMQSKPTIPEVSLIFGQDNSDATNSNLLSSQNTEINKNDETPMKTYADWKKQVLPKVIYEQPKVTFAPNTQTIKDEPFNGIQNAKTSIYPFRTATQIPSINSNTNQFSNLPIMNQGIMMQSASVNNDMQYKRFNDEINSIQSSRSGSYALQNQDFIYVSQNSPQQQQQQQQQHHLMQQRRSLESLSSMPGTPMFIDSLGKPIPINCFPLNSPQSVKSRDDVLSICAGTQTDFPMALNKESESSEVVTKEDFNRLMKIVECLREDQQRLLRFCETFLQNEQTAAALKENKPTDVAIQCDFTATNANSVKPSNVEDEAQKVANVKESKQIQPSAMAPASPAPPLALLNNKNFYNRLMDCQQTFQSPKTAKPIAQSTQYRPNTPKLIKPAKEAFMLTPAATVATAAVVTSLPKPTTEKSVVMNELALKYLPNDKLYELLQEMHISNGMPKKQLQTPPHPSNGNSHERALTPLKDVDNFIRSPNDMSNASYKYLKKYRLLPEDEKNENSPPIYQNNSNNNNNSPYQRSPMQNRSSTGSHPDNNIELNHLKNQPKFI